jgi:hypothetical protein
MNKLQPDLSHTFSLPSVKNLIYIKERVRSEPVLGPFCYKWLVAKRHIGYFFVCLPGVQASCPCPGEVLEEESIAVARLVNQETYCPAVPVPGPYLASGCREGSGGFCRSFKFTP